MKFILAFSICSAITGFCNNTGTLPIGFNSWSDCVGAGGKYIQTFSVEMKDEINNNKLYMNYFCNRLNMIDKFIYKFFAFWDDVIAKVFNCFDMDFSHCEKHDCPKKKKKANKNNKYFKS